MTKVGNVTRLDCEFINIFHVDPLSRQTVKKIDIVKNCEVSFVHHFLYCMYVFWYMNYSNYIITMIITIIHMAPIRCNSNDPQLWAILHSLRTPGGNLEASPDCKSQRNTFGWKDKDFSLQSKVALLGFEPGITRVQAQSSDHHAMATQ